MREARMQIGFGKVNVSPPPEGGGEMDLRILGFWYEREKRYGPIRDPLYARAMAVEAAGSRACLIAVDMIGDSIGFSEEARTEIQKREGLTAEAVMIACTHCHTSPETIGLTDHPVDARWRRQLVHGIADAASQAFSSLRPARLFLREGPLPGVAFNRCSANKDCVARLGEEARKRYAFLDETLRLASTEFKDGAPAGLAVNFACHPVGFQTQPFISADYPGVLVHSLEQTGGPALFANGPCGDVDPVRYRNSADVQWTGDEMVRRARELLDTAPPAEISGGIRGARRLVPLQRRPLRGPEELRRLEAETLAALAGAGPVDPDHWERTPHRRLYEIQQELALTRLPGTITAELHALEIGEWLILGVPGELVGCLGQEMRAVARKHRTWVVGYANGYLGYIPSSASFEAGNYEVRMGRWSRLAPGAGETLRDAAVQLIGEIER